MSAQDKKAQKLILRIFSIFIPLIALLFVAEKVWRARFQLFNKMDFGHLILVVLLGGMLYAVDNFFLVLAWRRLIDWLGKTKTAWKISLKIYGNTQIAKYLPGNIVQFPSRHIMGAQAGLKHGPLVGAAIFEIIGLLIASSSVFFLGNLYAASQYKSLHIVILIFGIAVFFPLAIQIIFTRVNALREMNLFPSDIPSMYKGLAFTWLIYLAFFVVAGLVLWIVIVVIDGSWFNPPLFIVISTYAISWLIGTVSPGMPGGLGVREAVSIYILSGYIGEPTSVLVTLLSRFIMVLGDIYFYFFVRVIR